MATITRSQRLLASAGAAALGGTALLTMLGGNIFTLAAAVDMTAPFGSADFPICHTPAATNTPSMMLRMAQTEVPRAEMSAAKSVPAFADTEAPLWTGLGNVTYKITTANERAQAYFDQGLRLAYAFNHGEAQRAFRMAQKLDPECAMCYWGEAYVLGPNINVPMDEKANAPAYAAAQKAKSLAARATPREQALIDAVSARYSADPKAERAKLDAAYAEAMGRAAASYPQDLDIAAIYAEALMDLTPWDYWQPGGKQPKPAVAPLIGTLERVLAKDPAHVGAIHLYIHAVEASADPFRAERYADRLAKLAPNAGHLVHMPAHIYFRIGRYKDSLDTNRVAVKIDEQYIRSQKPAGVYPLAYYPHNVHFVMVSAQMAGQARTALDAADKLAGVVSSDVAKIVLLLQPVKASPYFVHAHFSDPATVLALADPGADFPYVRTAWRYARGIARMKQNDAAGAAAELAEIEKIGATTDFRPFDAWKIPAKEVTEIAARVLRARMAQAKG